MNNRKKIIAPSILSADFANLENEIKKVSEAGADWIHVDVMDGHFVNNITIGIPVVESLKKISPLPLDVHLMIDNPEKYVDAFMKAGSDYLTIHVESTSNPQAVIQQIKKQGGRAGITLRPSTALSKIEPLLSLVDLVLVMTVEPGFGGQSFMHDQVDKIKKLRQEIDRNKWNCLIEVDGGINEVTARLCEDADVLVAGSYIFKNNYQEAIAKLKLER